MAVSLRSEEGGGVKGLSLRKKNFVWYFFLFENKIIALPLRK